jgi:hypothetical protein
MAYLFSNSTAISNISDISNGEVSITWKTGASYTYKLNDVEAFAVALSDIVENKKSIGSFINQQIQQNLLQLAN